MKPVWITDVAVTTGLGDLEQTWHGLLAGRSALRPVTRFATEAYGTRVAACAPELVLGGDASALLALVERAADRFAPVPADAHLLAATTKGGIDHLEALCRGSQVPPADYLFAVVLEALCERFGLRPATAHNVNAACASSTIALARAASLIALGRAEAVLVCCVDLVTEFVFSGFSSLQALDPEGCRPFDRERRGLSLGEGAALLLLMSAERARREERACRAWVRGWGVANDANHITAPARDGCGLIAAVSRALALAQLPAAAVAGISAHGTGTVYNDAMELTACRALFGAVPRPLHSVKGALGHTLAAAGGIEAALATCSLEEWRVPPTVGLRQPEPGAEGWVSGLPQPLDPGVLLTTNSGFGGVNAALLLAGEAAG